MAARIEFGRDLWMPKEAGGAHSQFVAKPAGAAQIPLTLRNITV